MLAWACIGLCRTKSPSLRCGAIAVATPTLASVLGLSGGLSLAIRLRRGEHPDKTHQSFQRHRCLIRTHEASTHSSLNVSKACRPLIPSPQIFISASLETLCKTRVKWAITVSRVLGRPGLGLSWQPCVSELSRDGSSLTDWTLGTSFCVALTGTPGEQHKESPSTVCTTRNQANMA